MTDFSTLPLSPALQPGLDALGYTTLTPVQAQSLPAILDGRDVIAQAPTGSGKTAAFGLGLLQAIDPSLIRVQALVLCPTRELADQVGKQIRKLATGIPNLKLLLLVGGVPLGPQLASLEGHDPHVVVGTPGRVQELARKRALNLGAVRTLVLDEADRMLDLGFSRELDDVFSALPRRRQTLLFSATFSDAIRQMARELLRDPLSIEVSPRNAAARSVKQWVTTVDKKRKSELFLHLLQERRWGQVLVFVKTRKGVDELVDELQRTGVSADAIHGDKPQPSRLRALERFKAGEVQILVATDVAARGLDIDDLPLVVNFDLPIVAEDYVHRIGRTGRAGATGEAISLVCADEVQLLSAIEVLIKQTLQRRDEPGFVPDHRVPQTDATGAILKKPKKPKKPKESQGKPGSARLGNWIDSEAPKAKAVRKGPGFGKAKKG